MNTSLTEVKFVRNNGNRNGMSCEKTGKSCLFYMRTGSHNVSLTQQYMSPTGEKIHWRETARCRLQISHADTNHTEYSYIALYEAQRVKSKYIRVIYLYLPFQPWAKELGDPQFKEEADVAKMTSHKSNSEIINLVDRMALVSFDLQRKKNETNIKRTHKTLFSFRHSLISPTLPGTGLSCGALRFFKMTVDNVKDTRWNAMVKKHSTS